ncbi:MAG: hypothetical protein GEV07_20220 [Streptosporangiales bacterium]|nr:hypothetical protein [Streptosporangiales bacterium]
MPEPGGPGERVEPSNQAGPGRRKRRGRPWLIAGIAGFVVLALVCGAAGNASLSRRWQVLRVRCRGALRPCLSGGAPPSGRASAGRAAQQRAHVPVYRRRHPGL